MATQAEQTKKKKHLGIVIVGHVDAGKSTTTGHLLFKLGGLSDRELAKLQAEADSRGKGSFAYAYYMDKQKEERERGVTISCTTKEFFTDNYHYTIIDAPGHRDFIKNMITGASQADVALLMVPANRGGFESAIAKGDHKKGIVQGQTRQHARLCKLLGVEQIIVGINKMDDTSVNYSEARYKEIKEEVVTMLKQAGYKPKRIPFIPMSGFRGENLIDKSDKMPWYKGFSVPLKKDGPKINGHTLLDALNEVAQEPKRPTDKKLRVPISGVFKIKGVGDIVTGRVEQGILRPGVAVRFEPSGATGKVFSVEMHHKNVEQALPGDNVGINVKNINKDNPPKTGDVLVLESEARTIVKTFKAVVAVQEHPGQLKCADKDGNGGFTPSIHIRSGKAPCRLLKIHWKMGPKSTKGVKIDDATFLQRGDQAEVTFEPKQPLFAESFEECEGLGRVAVMDSNSLVMLGKIVQIN